MRCCPVHSEHLLRLLQEIPVGEAGWNNPLSKMGSRLTFYLDVPSPQCQHARSRFLFLCASPEPGDSKRI